jgi:hypothetical protein
MSKRTFDLGCHHAEKSVCFGHVIIPRRMFALGMPSYRKECLLLAYHHAEMNVWFGHVITPKKNVCFGHVIMP